MIKLEYKGGKIPAPKVDKHAARLMLWTKSGLVLHAKMLETPRAYELLRRLAEAVPDEKFYEIFEQVMGMETDEQKKKVYVFDFGDKVKIGVSADVPKRKRNLETGGCQEVEKEWESAELDAKKAFELERRAHEHFAAYRLKGEYFRVTFEEARGVLEALTENWSRTR